MAAAMLGTMSMGVMTFNTQPAEASSIVYCLNNTSGDQCTTKGTISKPTSFDANNVLKDFEVQSPKDSKITSIRIAPRDQKYLLNASTFPIQKVGTFKNFTSKKSTGSITYDANKITISEFIPRKNLSQGLTYINLKALEIPQAHMNDLKSGRGVKPNDGTIDEIYYDENYTQDENNSGISHAALTINRFQKDAISFELSIPNDVFVQEQIRINKAAQSKLKSLDTQRNNTITKADKGYAQLKSLVTKYKALEAEKRKYYDEWDAVCELGNQSSAAEGKVKSLKSQIATIDKKISTWDADSAKRLQSLNKQLAAQNTTISSLTKQKSTADANVKSLQTQVSKATTAAKKAELNKKLTTAKMTQSNLAKKLESAKTAKASLQKQITAEQNAQKKTSHYTKGNAWLSKGTTVSNGVAALNTQKAALQKKLTAAQADYKTKYNKYVAAYDAYSKKTYPIGEKLFATQIQFENIVNQYEKDAASIVSTKKEIMKLNPHAIIKNKNWTKGYLPDGNTIWLWGVKDQGVQDGGGFSSGTGVWK